MTFADCLIDFPPRRPPLLASQFAYDLVLTGCFPLLISFFVFRFELYLQHLTNRLRSVFLFLQKFRLFFFFFLVVPCTSLGPKGGGPDFRPGGVTSTTTATTTTTTITAIPNPSNRLLPYSPPPPSLPLSRLSTGPFWWLFSPRHHASPGPLISSRLS